jgi:plasmid stability protein
MPHATAIDMSATWPSVVHMSKMIQIRNVPDDVHKTLKVRAAVEGLSLSDYIKRDLEDLAKQATLEDVFARARTRARTRARARGGSGITAEQIVAIQREFRGE